ncbi:MAG: hypothetical protein M1820_005881 [Bogoriella megaspora]|nr:MAG: hypothetical protein M1820_005881 [Bogoriella megaspora]
MPFHGHHGHSPNPHGTAASGIFQAANQLGAIGAPPGTLRVATGQTGAGTDTFYEHSADVIGPYGSAHGASASHTVPSSNQAAMSAPSSTVNSYNSQPFSTPKRQQAAIGQGEELHMPPGNQSMASQTPQSATQPQLYHSTLGFPTPAPAFVPSQSSSQSSHYSPSQHNALPGALQPGASARPGAATIATAPVTVPTMPQLNVNTNTQNTSNLSRSTTVSAHGYSRSSPAGLEQKYQPMSAMTPDTSSSKYPQTPGQRYYPQTPSGAASNSPLGLADIRPQIAASLGEDALGLGQAPKEDFDRPPANSNYLAPWPVYAFDWCKWNIHGGTSGGKMAVGSYLEDQHNFIQILDTQIAPQEVVQAGSPQYGLDFVKVAEATCAYPVTRILWEPPSSSKATTDLLATSGDHLRLWSLPSATPPSAGNTITRSSNNRDSAPQKLQPLALLSNSKSPEHTAPLTSLDWNTLSPKLIITSSIDTTCTIWDIPTLTAKTQLIAHDKEVFDVRFCAGSVDVFVSCGADGSVRMFDLRSLEHSTIIYEPSEKNDGKDKATSPHPSSSPTKAPYTPQSAHPPSATSAAPPTPTAPFTSPPLLRLAASPHDAHLLATFAADSNIIRVLDVRQPGTALLELKGHAASVNAVEWSPNRRGCLASGGDDGLVLVWDLMNSASGSILGSSGQVNGVSGQQGTQGGHGQGQAQSQEKGPNASWRCEYEVANCSWAPNSSLTGQGGEWVGVSGGRGIWGIKL